jgi:hypothetical protein
LVWSLLICPQGDQKQPGLFFLSLLGVTHDSGQGGERKERGGAKASHHQPRITAARPG